MPKNKTAGVVTESLVLRDKDGSGNIYLTLRDGIVIGAMGSDPKRYLGLSVARARHIARYGGK